MPKSAKERSSPATASKAEGAVKVSVSLFQADVARINAILAYALQRGIRMNASEAIRCALRLAAPSPRLLEAHEKARQEDRRRAG